MSLPSTEPFRREQLDLLGHVERLPVTAHELRSLPVDERIELIEEVVTFLRRSLLSSADPRFSAERAPRRRQGRGMAVPALGFTSPI